jgi:hypothetical protein
MLVLVLVLMLLIQILLILTFLVMFVLCCVVLVLVLELELELELELVLVSVSVVVAGAGAGAAAVLLVLVSDRLQVLHAGLQRVCDSLYVGVGTLHVDVGRQLTTHDTAASASCSTGGAQETLAVYANMWELSRMLKDGVVHPVRCSFILPKCI